MSIFKTIRDMDKRFSWSFLGFMVAIILGALTIYNEFFKENKPDLNYIITANTSVLDIRENLGQLDVLYQGESLSKNKKDLRLITFEVINQGDTAILSNFYDVNDPVGFSVLDGNIADEPTLIEASNSYLKEKLAIEKKSDSSVLFSNVILEEGEFFRIKILVLHDISKDPILKSFGKVAGVSKIDVLVDFESGNKRSFFEETFGGGIYSNVVRFITFGMALILLLITIFAMVDKIEKFQIKRKKNKLIAIFKEYESDKITQKDNFFFDYYMSHHAGFIANLYYLLSDSDNLVSLSKGERKPRRMRSISFFNSDDLALFNELLTEGFVTIEGDVVIVDPLRYSVLTDFFHFLKRKGEVRDRNIDRGFDLASHEKIYVQTLDK